MTLRAALVGTMLLVALAGCGGHDERLTVYLRARLGPEGPHGQIAPVLTPVERDRRAGMSPAWQAILDVRTGPSPDERAHGFLDTIDPQTRLRDVRVRDGVATVDLLGHEPDFYASGCDRLLVGGAGRCRHRPVAARRATLLLPPARRATDLRDHARVAPRLAGPAVRAPHGRRPAVSQLKTLARRPASPG